MIPGRIAARSRATATSVARSEARTHFISSADLMARAISTGSCASTSRKPWPASACAAPALTRSMPTRAPLPTSPLSVAAVSAAQRFSRAPISGPAATKLAVMAGRISSMVSRPAARCMQPVNSCRITGPSTGSTR